MGQQVRKREYKNQRIVRNMIRREKTRESEMTSEKMWKCVRKESK